MSAQEKFFQFLSHRLGKKVVLQEAMSQLHLQRAAVYKRLNNDTALSLAEAVKLARHFGVSIDTATELDGYYAFAHPFMHSRSSTSFLQSFSEIMTPTLPNEEMEGALVYLANELPVFYYLSYDHIFRFLIAVWNHLHWSHQELYISNHEPADPVVEALRRQVSDYYYSRRVTEIWNSGMLANLFQQVLFAINIKAFACTAIIEALLHDLDQLFHDLRTVAFSGRRSEGDQKSIQVYINEFGNYQNMVLFSAENLCATGIGFDMPQFIISHDQALHRYSLKWVDKIKRRSVNITTGSYSYSEVFFDQLEDALANFKLKAQRLISIRYA